MSESIEQIEARINQTLADFDKALADLNATVELYAEARFARVALQGVEDYLIRSQQEARHG